MVIATALDWHDLPSVVLSIVLAFVFGYGLTVRPLLASGIPAGRASRLAFASDTVSITVMELVDTATILLIPGAMAAGLTDPLFWGSLAAVTGDRRRHRLAGQPLADRPRPRPRGDPRRGSRRRLRARPAVRPRPAPGRG